MVVHGSAWWIMGSGWSGVCSGEWVVVVGGVGEQLCQVKQPFQQPWQSTNSTTPTQAHYTNYINSSLLSQELCVFTIPQIQETRMVYHNIT